MNVLLTGGAGYIGSVTAEALLDAGHRVTVFDNLERGHREAVDPRARLIVGDLRRADAISEAMRSVRPDAVLHFAAFALVGESMERPELYFHNNVVGGFHLIEAMRQVGVRRIVFSSTCATYGVPERIPISEDAPQRPLNPYGESKLMLETMLRWFADRYGFEPVFLRYFNACGATERLGEDHDPETHLIPNVLRVALGRAPAVRVFGADYPTPDGTCIRDYIHVLDLADAHIRALETAHTGAFNLGNGLGFSVREVIDTARAVTGHPLPEEIAPRRPGDPPTLVADAKRARSLLGWQPRYSDLRTIIEHAWRWHRRHPDGYAGSSQ
ncbi:MAG: UDP-glucose 4-epimerase GalE [Kiritimatiellae bacterium]|nr:UDP-glucose 4-epimerase GalE [Kiritimatiellia bacterium]